jgi:UDP-GlcNAc:undecaprenyl-phosphate GlcNAc-1-phosphate transferase
VTNALNFNDNMNGLCGGLGLVAAGWIAFLAARNGQYLVASLALLVAGALAGFLPYNFPRASVFLGDSGSHLVGYLLAVLAILPHFYSAKLAAPSRLAVLSPLFILAVPLVDLARVVCVRTLAGRPFWLGDTNHLSHRLVRAGLTKPRAVGVLWAAAAVAGSLSLL